MTDLAQTDEGLRLAGLRDELVRARGQLLAAAFGTADPGRGQAEHDGASLVQRQAEAVLDGLQRRTLARVNAALDRFDDGTYGTCVDCAGPIPVERLEVMPATSRCLECQHQREATHAYDPL